VVLALGGGKPSASGGHGTTTTTTLALATRAPARPSTTLARTKASSTTTTSTATSTTLPTASTTTTVAPVDLVSPSSVLVQVVNGFGGSNAATDAASALHNAGFTINGTGDAQNFTYHESVIEYSPGNLSAAQTLDNHVVGPVHLEQVSDLPANDEVVLILGSTYGGVAA